MGGSESKEGSSTKADGLFSGTEMKEEKREETKEAAKVSGALVAAGLVAWGVSSLISSGTSSGNKDMMKAPGKKGTLMLREDFESNPKDYFKDLRAKRT